MSINYTINVGMFEFALKISRLLKYGYEIKEIKYGEERLGIDPALVLVKDGIEICCYSVEEIECLEA